VTTFWHTITGSLLAMYWRLRGFPAGEDPHATVRELRRRAEESSAIRWAVAIRRTPARSGPEWAPRHRPAIRLAADPHVAHRLVHPFPGANARSWSIAISVPTGTAPARRGTTVHAQGPRPTPPRTVGANRV